MNLVATTAANRSLTEEGPRTLSPSAATNASTSSPAKSYQQVTISTVAAEPPRVNDAEQPASVAWADGRAT